MNGIYPSAETRFAELEGKIMAHETAEASEHRNLGERMAKLETYAKIQAAIGGTTLMCLGSIIAALVIHAII